MSAFFMFIALSVTIVVVLVGLALRAEQKRKAAVIAGAADLGLVCCLTLAAKDRSLFDTFPLAGIGHSRDVTSASEADSGELRMILFDYQYTVGTGKNQNTRTYSVVMATSDNLELPQFSLSPENFFDRLGDWFGSKDIDFKDDPLFSNQFVLKGEDEAAIRDLFTPRRRAALVPLGQIYIDARGSTFLCYRSGRQRDVAHLRNMLEEGLNVSTQLSGH